MVKVGRSPVLVLWAVVVAERLGFERSEALTLGRALSGLAGQALTLPADVFEPTPERLTDRRAKLEPGETLQVSLMHRAVPVINVDHGFRAVSKGRPINPQAVERYLADKFGDGIGRVTAAMKWLADSLSPHELALHAVELYQQFRPENGELDLDRIISIARPEPRGPLATAFHLNDRSHETLEDDVEPEEQPSFRGPYGHGAPSRAAYVVAPSRALTPHHLVPDDAGQETAAAGRSLALVQLRSAQSEESLVQPEPRPLQANRVGLVALAFVLLVLAAAGGGFVGAYLMAESKSGTLVAGIRNRVMPAASATGEGIDPAEKRVAAASENDPPAEVNLATLPPIPSASTSEPKSIVAVVEPAPPTIPAAAGAEASSAGTTTTAPAKTETAKVEPTYAEPAKVEPIKTEAAMNGPSMAAPAAVASEQVALSMQRGDDLMKHGDVIGARRFYEIAASGGDPRAATAVGRTFDPAYLQQAGVRGPLANSAKARQWYEKAMRGGDTEARLLLFRLSTLSKQQ